MQTLATGNKTFAPDAGVTLVEVMTALLIISLMAGAVLLMAPGPDRKTRQEAERLGARAAMASEESIIVNRTLALVVTNEGYGFERLEETGWTPARVGTPLGFRSWPTALDARIEGTSAERGDARIARFDPQGGATPASVVLSGSGARWRVSIDGQGAVDVEQVE